MSAVLNVRGGMDLAGKSELVGPTKRWPDIFFLQLHCRDTYLRSAEMLRSAPNTYTERDQRDLDYRFHQHFSYFFLRFKIGIEVELSLQHCFNFRFLD